MAQAEKTTPGPEEASETPATEPAPVEAELTTPEVQADGPAPIPANPALIPHENADTAGSHGLPGEQLRTRSAQAIADEINAAEE
ncbi:MAG: hypothetical protein WAU42_14755 [Solirubrobacteraceae bacterium]